MKLYIYVVLKALAFIIKPLHKQFTVQNITKMIFLVHVILKKEQLLIY